MTEDMNKQTNESVGARLARLRRAQNITQEEVAERLGISRQAVSKWESDLAYPETEKLLALSRLYGCTVDHLLTGEMPAADTSAHTAEKTAPSADEAHEAESPNLWERVERSWGKRPRYFEYKSRRTLRGTPLVHINIGFGRKARGIVAIGLSAKGVVSLGLCSMGVLSLGLCSLGILSVGILSLGLLLSVGSIAVGAIAVGAVAAGILAIGALSAGLISVGALAMGYYVAVGDHAYGLIALGGTVAEGDLFSALAPTIQQWKSTLLPEMLAQVDAHVPAWLRAVAKAILRGVR
jgi:transcriptional regulator with XRE-family HTH domain